MSSEKGSPIRSDRGGLVRTERDALQLEAPTAHLKLQQFVPLFQSVSAQCGTFVTGSGMFAQYGFSSIDSVPFTLREFQGTVWQHPTTLKLMTIPLAFLCTVPAGPSETVAHSATYDGVTGELTRTVSAGAGESFVDQTRTALFVWPFRVAPIATPPFPGQAIYTRIS